MTIQVQACADRVDVSAMKADGATPRFHARTWRDGESGVWRSRLIEGGVGDPLTWPAVQRKDEAVGRLVLAAAEA